MDKIKVALIGLGDRGVDIADTLLLMPDVEIGWICDFREERRANVREIVEKAGRHRPRETADYRDILQDPSVDAVLTATSWSSHVPITCDAMRAGKYAAFEVGPASNLEEAWRLVRTYEETRVPCMMMSNCNYGYKELSVLRMIRSGLFGEITHVQGGYFHDMRRLAHPDKAQSDERARHNIARCGDLYPDHALGPIMNYLNINRGNRMLSLVSMASKAVNFTRKYQELKTPEMPDIRFKMADVVQTMIRCANGETILLTHDISCGRPYSRGGMVHGTKAIWYEEMKGIYIDGVTEGQLWADDTPYLEQYSHPLWKEKDKMKEWHHGGMDYLLLSSFVESVKNHTQTRVDAYDSATLLAVPVLTEMSIQQGSAPVEIPDFTQGGWLHPEEKPRSLYSLDVLWE